MKVLVLGLGINGGGRAACLYFARRDGYEVRVSDVSPRSSFGLVPQELEKLNVKCFFEDKDPKENIKWADLVIKNPAVPTSLPQLSLAKRIGNDFSFLFSSPQIKRIKLIAVTGTKGKTTTVSAISHALSELGKDTLVCGNIGISAFTVLEEIERRKAEGKASPEYIVMELSSWQIHDTYIALNGHMPHFTMTIFTSKYADHQNSYSNVNDYYDDKLKLFTPECDTILVNSSNKDFLVSHTFGLKKLIKTFPGYYNPFKEKKMELQCAYCALRLLGFNRKDTIRVLSSYKGMPHRIEQVALYDDIMFINDSAATIAEAVNFSMKNISPLPVHLICGGTDKNLKASGMLDALRSADSISLLAGSFTDNQLIPLLEKNNLKYEGPFTSMKEAFNDAVEKAEEKRNEFRQVQCVLLSPGAASFEYFKNEFDRGTQFKALVRLYTARKSGKKTFPLDS